MISCAYQFTRFCLQAPDIFACTWMEDSPDQTLATKLLKKECILQGTELHHLRVIDTLLISGRIRVDHIYAQLFI